VRQANEPTVAPKATPESRVRRCDQSSRGLITAMRRGLLTPASLGASAVLSRTRLTNAEQPCLTVSETDCYRAACAEVAQSVPFDILKLVKFFTFYDSSMCLS